MSQLRIAVLMLCAGSGVLFGQATASTSLTGVVMDQTEAVIPNAHVEISNVAIGLIRSANTNQFGLYRFDLLPVGTYQVRIGASGFTTEVFPGVELVIESVGTINATLHPSPNKEEVTVEGGGIALLDQIKTDVSLPVTPELLQDLPLNGRDFMNLALLAPGATPVDAYDPTKKRMGVFAVDGSDGRNVNLTVNGVDDKDNTVGGVVMQLPLEAIEEFSISTQRFSAANGRSEGAAINVITRSGSNTLHGSGYIFGRDQALNTQNYFETAKAPYQREQFGGSLGGPLRKDRTFLFFAIERTREETNIAVDPASLAEIELLVPLGAKPAANIPTPYFDWRYNGRLDHHFNDRHTLSLSYSNQNNRAENDQSGSQNDLTQANFTTNQLILASATVTSILSPRAVNAFTAGYQSWNNRIDSEYQLPYLTFPSGVSIGTGPLSSQQSSQAKWQFRNDFSFTTGQHTLRLGGDFVWEPKLGGFFQYNPTPELDFLVDPSQILGNPAQFPEGLSTPGLVGAITETSGDPYLLLSPKMLGVYIEDTWKATPRLTLNLGLRWDRDFDLMGGAEQARNQTYLELKAINSPYAAHLPHDDLKDFSPRVGLAYDLTGRGRHVIRAGYGLYYGQVFENIPALMLQQANPIPYGAVVALSSAGPGDPNASPVPGTNLLLSQWRYGVDPIPPVPPPLQNLQDGTVGQLLSPDYRNPFSQQFNAGYAFQITPGNLVEAEYVHTLGLHESKTIDVDPGDPSNGGARPLDAVFAAKGLPVLAGVDAEMAIGRSRYDGLNLSYRRRLSRRLSLNAHYVLSRAIAYDGSAASLLNYPSDPRNWFAPHDFGPTPSDERHRLVVAGIIDLPWKLRFSTLMQLASARPYNSSQGIDVFGTGDTLFGANTTAHAILLKNDPSDYLATVNYSADQLRACLNSGACFEAPYDSLRGQAFFQLDARIERAFKLRERGTLELLFQGFDLTNRANFGNNYVGNIQSSQFGQPVGFITPSGVIVPRSFSGEFGAIFRF